jgi:hypothetical protein
VDAARVIVRVSGRGRAGIVSALGEAASAEAAEDRARLRLQQLIQHVSPATPSPAAVSPTAAAAAPPPDKQGHQAKDQPDTTEALQWQEPEDWSDELTAVDMELQRLGWQREQEGCYLQRAFGHPSRSRLVGYADLVSYLKQLRCLEPGADAAAAPLPLRRAELLSRCDQLLQQLQWGQTEGREALEQHFSCGSRQQLSDDQLQQFNALLEGRLVSG